ncbi:hypothetical protein EJ05DRAFT_535306 [Pseudovirgaria hyperparasitica]|uniref:Nitrogen permease regulator 3 n=1 Tax=Pseudovirgaria hyperparasitica TaxID=470096 RepID=A0A6A6WID6_9PEZI|nr:uncharacterized protein EJ05DRAFT_535306 [Pseudovirgaria hyperparasitica]KAF2762009.1 hypothetical protein EJ05DRAFT_535306 [Pseudovirgaria hyperparasitica]
MQPNLSQSSHLVAIVLVAKSLGGGPKLVFHYPPKPVNPSSSLFSNGASASPAWYGNASSATDTVDGDSESGWGDGESSSEDDAGDEGDHGSKSGKGSTAGGKSSGTKGRGIWNREDYEDEDDEADLTSKGYDLSRKAMKNNAVSSGQNIAGKENGEVDWDRVLGFQRTSLEKLLSPHKALHKRKFEIGVDGCYYIGVPMFIRDDGLWRKKRRRQKKSSHRNRQESFVSSSVKDKTVDNDKEELYDDEDEGIDVGLPYASRTGIPEMFEAGYGHASASASETGSTSLDNDMSMFHVVFVLNPPALEYQPRVKEMYDNIARKFSKALKREQAKSNYVWKESKKILGIKIKAREKQSPISIVWPNILNASTLAKSLAIIYDSISNSKIAHIHLDAASEASFQIPQQVSTPYLPTSINPQPPGLWLTTSNVIDDDDTETPFTHRYALLLLEDCETLIREIEGAQVASSTPIAFYLRSLVPTKSLHKISVTQSIPIQDIEYIADHLLYWRRARLIPPLHHRDTYVVSPNADLRALSAAIPAYAARFPTMPSLPQMLALMSGVPRAYSLFIPTPDHRTRYMEILAWLMRGGWVTQLRTFAWVKVTPEIKAAVAVEMAAEEEAARNETDQISSPQRRAARENVRPPSTASNTSSNRTTLSPKITHAAHKRLSPLSISTSSPPHSPPSPITAHHSPTSRPTAAQVPGAPLFTPQPGESASDFTTSLILNPLRATAVEARWLEHIRDGFQDKEVRELWPTLLKYFDGRRALEDVAVREGVKRKRVQAVIASVREGGWLVHSRHW